MIYFLIYIIKSTFCLTLFYLFFKALLSRETFFRFNRFVLLAGMIICAVLPLIELNVSKTNLLQEPVVQIENFFITTNPSNQEIITNEQLIIEPEQTSNIPLPSSNSPLTPSNFPLTPSNFPLTPSNFPISQIAVIFYLTGFLITLISLFVSIFKMIRIIHTGTKIKKEKYTIVCISRQICPFSWGRYIVLSEDDYRQSPNEIITHESIHSNKLHSLDLLFAELFILFHWFNPVAWLLKGELHDIHEYEADRGVINQGIDATKYQLMLVKKAVGARSYAIANSFNHSKIKIKNRITMMLKEKSTQRARFKLLLFAPLVVVLLQAFARPETVRIQESLIDSENTTISQQSQKWSKDYFDEKIDAYLKQVNGNTKECEKWSRVDLWLNDKYWIWPVSENMAFIAHVNFENYTEGYDAIITHLKNEEIKRCKENLHSPSIAFLTIKDISDSDMQTLLDELGKLNEEFLKAREEQKKKAWEKNINTKFTEMYSNVPIYVAIDERIKRFPSVFNEKKTQSPSQQKMATINNENAKEIVNSYEKGNEVIIKNGSDSTENYTLKGTMMLKLGEQEITLSGDSVDIILKKVKSVNFSNNTEHVEKLLKSMEKIPTDPVGYTSISSDIDNFKKIYDLNNNHFYIAKQQQDERKTQIEKRQKEWQKQSEERLKENQKRREEQIKQSEERLKERKTQIEKRQKEQKKQSEQRLKENQKRQKEQQNKTEQRLKERQNQIDKRQKEQQKRVEQRG